MIFPKPNLRYTEMAMYIDDKTKDGQSLTEHEEELIYIYLYHIVRMLAYKKHYFNKTNYYDEFSLIMASDMMNRLIYNPKLNEVDEFGNPKMKRIKSCLNYIKSIMYGRKVLFEQKFYSQKISRELTHSEITELSFANQIKTNRRSNIDSNIKLYMGELGKTINDFINHNCEYKDKIIRKNIKISCYLSLLNMVIFTNEISDNIENKFKTPEAKFNYLCIEYDNNRKNSVVLYHLNEEYRNYITIMVRRINALIEKDIKELGVGDVYVSDDVLADIAFAELDGKQVYYDD